MRKPWEETGSHRERFLEDDRPRRFDRRMDERDGFGRSDRNDFPRRSDRPVSYTHLTQPTSNEV